MNLLIFASIAVVFLARELYVAYHIFKIRREYRRYHEISAISVPTLPYRMIKRMIDIIISLLLCLSILPIMFILLGIIIKLTSKGPVIFKQKRVGMFTTEFTCYKFRSMYVNADDKIVIKSSDKRITPIGRFLRKTHLDEFPQFFNVLIGNMSVVGPRPLLKKEFEQFRNKKEAYTRLIVRPGITGLAQMKSGRFLPKEDYLQYDMDYLTKPSLIRDIKLICQTLKFNDVTC